MGTDSPEQNKTTDLVCLAGLTSGLICTLIAANLMPEAGRFWAYTTILSRLLMYWGTSRTRSGKIYAELLSMGLIAGFIELLADYYLIHWVTAGRLVYVASDAILLDSPLWMPFAWTCVVTELGYVGLRLARIGRQPWLGAIAGGLLAGVTIGVYEYFAYQAGWWYYESARRMIGTHCALYIPLAEAIMFSLFYPIFTRTQKIEDGTLRAIARGSLFGATIFASCVIAHLMLEGR
jgi:hypothetical protein